MLVISWLYWGLDATKIVDGWRRTQFRYDTRQTNRFDIIFRKQPNDAITFTFPPTSTDGRPGHVDDLTLLLKRYQEGVM